jgi:hypothetical protein
MFPNGQQQQQQQAPIGPAQSINYAQILTTGILPAPPSGREFTIQQEDFPALGAARKSTD